MTPSLANESAVPYVVILEDLGVFFFLLFKLAGARHILISGGYELIA